MMREERVIARPRSNGSVLMQHIFSKPDVAANIHHITLAVNNHLMVVIWRPERILAQAETDQNQQLYVNKTKFALS